MYDFDFNALLGIAFVFWWLVGAFAVGVTADARGRNRGPWFWLSFFVGPILAMMILIAYPAKFADN